jgi:hypothetical protein
MSDILASILFRMACGEQIHCCELWERGECKKWNKYGDYSTAIFRLRSLYSAIAGQGPLLTTPAVI